jgi:hypothetical protein
VVLGKSLQKGPPAESTGTIPVGVSACAIDYIGRNVPLTSLVRSMDPKFMSGVEFKKSVAAASEVQPNVNVDLDKSKTSEVPLGSIEESAPKSNERSPRNAMSVNNVQEKFKTIDKEYE